MKLENSSNINKKDSLFINYCKNCNAICCKNWVIFATINDVKRIKREIKKDFIEFSDFDIVPEEEYTLYKEQKNYFYDYIIEGKVLQIKKINNICVFLKENRCSIYNIRPIICKIYPIWFFQKNKEIVIDLSIDYYNNCIIPHEEINNYIIKNYYRLIKLYRLYVNEMIYYKNNIKKFVKRYYNGTFVK